MKKKKTPQYFIGKFFKFLLLVFFVVYTLFPLVWLLLTSIKSKKEMYNFPLEYWPDHPTLINYQEVMGMGNFGRYTLNSFLLALAVGAGAAIFSLMVAYVLARMDFKLKPVIMGLFLMTQMLPGAAGFAPLYILMSRLGMVNRLTTVMIIMTAGSITFGMFLQLGFLQSIPSALEDAAMIDGCGRARMFRHVIIPLSKPGMFTVFIFQFLSGWNDVYTSVLYINNDKKKTLAVAIYSMIGTYDINWGNVAAGTTIAMVPAIILFTCMKDIFIENIGGAVKE